jgi:HPt (histidine-containing phosphotransfer) domain-containing protein
VVQERGQIPLPEGVRTMSELAVLDLDELIERTGGEREFAVELLGDFLETLPGDIAEIKEILDRGNLEEIVQKAHAIKGAAASLSAEMFSDIAKRIEYAGRDLDLEAARGNFDLLVEEGEKLKAAISQVI